MVVAAFLLVQVLAEWSSVAGALLPQGALSGIKIILCLFHAGSCLLSGLEHILQLLIGKPLAKQGRKSFSSRVGLGGSTKELWKVNAVCHL